MAVDRFRFLEKQRNYIGKMGSDDMRMKDVEARKAYIQNVRKSFDSPKRQYEFEKETDAKGGEASDSLSLPHMCFVIRRGQSFITFPPKMFQRKLRKVTIMGR